MRQHHLIREQADYQDNYMEVWIRVHILKLKISIFLKLYLMLHPSLFFRILFFSFFTNSFMRIQKSIWMIMSFFVILYFYRSPPLVIWMIWVSSYAYKFIIFNLSEHCTRIRAIVRATTE